MKKSLPEVQFWRWFERNCDVFLRLQEQRENGLNYWRTELNAHLGILCEGVYADLRCDQASGQVMVIFRQLSSDIFHQELKALTEAAPELPGWCLTASPESVVLHFPDAGKLHYSLVEDVDEGGRPGLIVYMPVERAVPEALKVRIANMVTKLLAQAACPVELAAIAVESSSEQPGYNNLPTLAQLPVCLAQLRRAS